VTLYLDTSSLVKMYVEEDGSSVVLALVERSDTIVTSVVAFVETRAALAHLRRSRNLTPANYAEAKRRFAEDWPSVVSIEVSEALARLAGDLAEKHGLRGFDSIHLATFAHVLERSEDDVEFSSFDKRMVAAARKLDA